MDTARNHVVLTTNRGVEVLVDQDTAERLNGRSLSQGSHGYVQIFDGTTVLLHRWVLGLVVGDGVVADHINGDVLDNRRCNLRAVDGTKSNMNRSVRGRCVYPMRGRWQAKLQYEGKMHHLGTFDTPEQADEAVATFREEHGIVYERF